jgi:hypothetical protein
MALRPAASFEVRPVDVVHRRLAGQVDGLEIAPVMNDARRPSCGCGGQDEALP